MSKWILGIASIACFCWPLIGKTEASILTFDDVAVLTGDAEVTLGSYGGLNWSNMAVVNGSTIGGGTLGYNGGRVSGAYVAYNRFGTQAKVENGTFDFISVYLAAVFRNGLQVQVQGFLNGNLLYDETVRLLDASATPGAGAQKFEFNFNGIDQLTFSSFGGSIADLGGFGPQFTMDNFEFAANDAIPEPGSFLVWGVLAVAGVGVTSRRRIG
jgi:hypothetical protein